MCIIRKATKDDVEELVKLGEEFFRETTFGRYVEYEPERVTTVVHQMIENGVALVAIRQGISGFAGGLPIPLWFGGDTFSCMAVWVKPEIEGGAGAYFIRDFIREVKKKGCESVVFTDLALREGRVGRLFERLGMQRIETNWICEV